MQVTHTSRQWSLSSTILIHPTPSQPAIQNLKPHLSICVYIAVRYLVVVSGKGKGFPVCITKAHWCVDLQLHSLSSVLLDGVKWSVLGPVRFTSGGEALGTQWTGGWVGPRAGLNALNKRKPLLSLLGNRTPYRSGPHPRGL